MAKKGQAETIKQLQNDKDYIILNNPLAIPKFVRTIGKQGKERVLNKVYTPKIFFEIVSQLTPQHLLDNTNRDYVCIDFSIGDFLKAIGTKKTNNDYNHVINCIKEMQKLSINFENDEFIKGFSVIPYYKYEKGSGLMQLDIRKELAQSILQVKQSENFSFLKQHLFRLENAQAIKLFPFFVSWKNRGMVEMKLDNFKQKFGYNTEGYSRFASFNKRVLNPAITEINKKTDLNITLKLMGENLTGTRPRITGLQFFIKEKEKTKELSVQHRKEEPLFEDLEKVPQPIEPIVKQQESDYLKETMRVFAVFEPQSTVENIEGFLSAYDSLKEVLEGALYCEKQKKSGYKIGNFRAFLKTVIKEKQGVGILEQTEKEKDKKITEQQKIQQLESSLQEAEAIKEDYKKAINEIIRNTATEAEKENIVEILRGQGAFFAKLTLEKCREKQYISSFIGKFIEVYADRFDTTQRNFKEKYTSVMIEVEKLDKDKYKELVY
jgi:hypothetical protein